VPGNEIKTTKTASIKKHPLSTAHDVLHVRQSAIKKAAQVVHDEWENLFGIDIAHATDARSYDYVRHVPERAIRGQWLHFEHIKCGTADAAV